MCEYTGAANVQELSFLGVLACFKFCWNINIAKLMKDEVNIIILKIKNYQNVTLIQNELSSVLSRIEWVIETRCL